MTAVPFSRLPSFLFAGSGGAIGGGVVSWRNFPEGRFVHLLFHVATVDAIASSHHVEHGGGDLVSGAFVCAGFASVGWVLAESVGPAIEEGVWVFVLVVGRVGDASCFGVIGEIGVACLAGGDLAASLFVCCIAISFQVGKSLGEDCALSPVA